MFNFEKYPKTLAEQLVPTMPGGVWTAQEKMDGANARIEYAYDPATEIHTLRVASKNQAKAELSFTMNRGIIVTPLAEYDPIGGLVNAVSEAPYQIAQFMHDNDLKAIHGEWLVPHTLKYPEHQYNHFYVFDLVKVDGTPVDPDSYVFGFAPLGFVPVVAMKFTLTDADRKKNIADVLRDIAYTAGFCGRPSIEGVVIKNYDLDAAGARDEAGGRYCYKHVLPEFKEDHANSKMFPVKLALTNDERLAAYLPERSIEKVVANVKAANGGRFENKLIPVVMKGVWREFCEEHLIPALEKEKHPIVNTKQLKAEVERKARDFVLSGQRAS